MNTPSALLEAYLEAKDLNSPSIILECFTPEAVLTYSIATNTISFPSKVIGSNAIAQTLVRDLREKFEQCKTYYLCASIDDLVNEIDYLPWLVVMREISSGVLRLGKGYYKWRFEREKNQLRVCAMHIHIERMDVIDDPDQTFLNMLQAVLPYPWLPPEVLRARIEHLLEVAPNFSFLESFKRPSTRSLSRGL